MPIKKVKVVLYSAVSSPLDRSKHFTLFAHPGYSILLTHEVLDKIIFSHGKHGALVRVHRDRQLMNSISIKTTKLYKKYVMYEHN